MRKTGVLVLLSGGIDSAACAAYYRRSGYPVTGLWIDYGCPATSAEEKAVERIAGRLEINLKKVAVAGMQWRTGPTSSLELTARNMTFAALAMNCFPYSSGLISMGLHKNSHYVDCGLEFQGLMDQSAALLTDDRVRMDFPFRDLTKVEVVQYALSSGVGPPMTYSCLSGTPVPCGECASCLDLKQSLVMLGRL